jgi:uncharacterized protein YfaS (alpha-2-macroglobulin family)
MSVNYDKGDLVRIAAVFRNSAGALIDPTVVLFKFTTPALVTTTYTYPADAQLVKDSTGNYHVDLDANANGRWLVRFYSTGTGQAAAEDEFFVTSNF